MKLVLLASGLIAENILKNPLLFSRLNKNLVGVVASDNIIDLFHHSKDIEILILNNSEKQEIDLINLITNTNPDYILSIQYPWILSKKIIDLMSGRVLNLHNARLPNYRGHNALSHEILNCEKNHTTTLHWISAEVDRGRTVFTKEIEIFDEDTAFSLWKRSISSCHDLLEEWFESLAKNRRFPTGTPVKNGGTFFSKNIAPLKRIPDDATPDVIDRWSRAFWFPPHEPAYMEFAGKKFYVLPDNWKYNLND